MKDQSNSRLVYSTEKGRVCPHCGLSNNQCRCQKKKKGPSANALTMPKDGIVRIRREKQGRKGKAVTAVYGLPLTDDELVDLARSLKRLCGSGGTVKDSTILVQGDHRDAVLAELQRLGFSVRLSGG